MSLTASIKIIKHIARHAGIDNGENPQFAL